MLDPDPRAGRQVQLGFEREGVPTVVMPVQVDSTKFELGDPDPALVLIGGSDGRALDLVQRARKLLLDSGTDIPIVWVGTGVKRAELEKAGADEVVTRPAYLRDVVTIGRILRGVPAAQRGHLVGSLVETTGVYTLVRALAALGRSAVLTLIRGLRRGEVRFYRGEVTSAQVGLIHGQAALHQLLLWTDARFDFHHEDIVRRQQIPLAPEELFADAERFLEGVRDSAGRLSPAMVLEQNVERVHTLGKQIPTEVHGVLRMFDGHRVLADVLEDSPYRVFETLRVAQKAIEVGLLKIVDGHKPKATWRTLLTIEEWLVGSETREAVAERTSQLDMSPVNPTKKTGSRKKRKKRRANTPLPVPATRPEIDWGALVPRVVGAEVGPLSGVVPAMDAAGEIVVATREAKREGLEALMDTDKRTKIFPTEIGVEPTVVFDEVAEAARATKEDADKARDRAEVKAASEAAEAKQHEEAQRIAAKLEVERSVKAREAAERDEDAKRIREDAQTKIREAAEREQEAQRAREAAQAKAREAAEREQEARHLRAEAEAAARAAAEREQEAQRVRDEAQAKVQENVERMRLERDARELAAAHAKPEDERQVRLEAARREAEQSMAQVKAALERRQREEAESRAQAIAEAEAKARRPAEGATPVTSPDDIITAPIGKVDLESSNPSTLVKQLVSEALESVRTRVAEPVTLTETPTATVSVADTIDIVASKDTVVVTATPVVTVSETPTPIEDEPSDGVVRAMIATADTARIAARSRRPSSQPLSDGPPEKEKTGEIGERPKRNTIEPSVSEPSILVTDLAAAHSFVSAAASASEISASATPPPAPALDASTPAHELAVAETRKDAAVAFTDAEEAFFKHTDATHSHKLAAPQPESFDDLDEGYEPPKFWDRVFGRRKRSSSTMPPPKK